MSVEDFLAYIEAGADIGDEELDQSESNSADYWHRLQPIIYSDAEQAKVPFKQFMKTHIRYYIPGIFKNLITDQPAVKKWGDLKYLMDNLSDH